MFSVGPAAVTVYSDGKLCSSEACNNAQTHATIAVTESKYVFIVRVPRQNSSTFLNTQLASCRCMIV